MPKPGGGGAGGPGGPAPIFGRSVNPIPTGGGHIIPTYYYWPPNFFHLPASLDFMQCNAGLAFDFSPPEGSKTK